MILKFSTYYISGNEYFQMESAAPNRKLRFLCSRIGQGHRQQHASAVEHLFFFENARGLDYFVLADGREVQNHLKQITIGGQLHGAVLQFGQALCDG